MGGTVNTGFRYRQWLVRKSYLFRIRRRPSDGRAKPECPVMATSGCSGHAAGPTALPLKADLQAATSAFLAWRSALPRTADAVGRGPPGPVMTLSGHRGRLGGSCSCRCRCRSSSLGLSFCGLWFMLLLLPAPKISGCVPEHARSIPLGHISNGAQRRWTARTKRLKLGQVLPLNEANMARDIGQWLEGLGRAPASSSA